jgi:hypothetical protein
VGNQSAATPGIFMTYNYIRANANPVVGDTGLYPRDDSNCGKSHIYFQNDGGIAFATLQSDSNGTLPTQRMIIESDGFVGIGAASPGYALEVAGDINATSNLRQGGALIDSLYAASNGQSNWDYGSNTAAYASNTSVWGSNNFSNYSTTAVVNADYATSNGQSNWNYGSNTANWASNNSGGRYWTSTSSNVTTLSNVGIGTVSPSATLHVAGSASNSGVFSTRYFLLTPGDNTDSAGSSNDGGPWYGLGLSVESGFSNNVPQLAGYAGILLKSANGLFAMTQAGNVGVGTTSPGYKLDVNGITQVAPSTYTSWPLRMHNPSVSNNFTGILIGKNSNTHNCGWILHNHLGTDGSASNYIAIGTVGQSIGAQLVVSGNSNVGIGTTAPTEKLQVVNGDINVANGAGGGAGGALKFGTGGQPTLAEMASIKGVSYNANLTFSNLSGGMIFYTRSNNTSSNTTLEARMSIGQDGRVGIGTTTPGYTLDVNGDMEISPSTNTAVPLRVLNSAVSNAQTSVLYGKAATNYNSGWFNFQHLGTDGAQSNYISMGTWGQAVTSAPLNVTGYGNVGIGTSAPAYKLDITGGCRASSDFLAYANSAIAFTLSNSNTVANLGIAAQTGQYSSSALVNDVTLRSGSNRALILQSGTNAGAVYISSNNNVGIGGSAPTVQLDVTGDVRASGYIQASAGSEAGNGFTFDANPGAGAGDSAWIRYYARSGENCTLEIGLSNDTADHIALMPVGNVGIGTTNPSDRLHVVGGNINVSNGGNVADAGGAVDFGITTYPTYGEMAQIKGVLVNTNGSLSNLSGGIAFLTRSNNSASNTTPVENMRLTHYGYLGIGATQPKEKLHVIGDAIISNGGNAGGNGGALKFGINAFNALYGEMSYVKGVLQYANSNSSNFSGGIAFYTRSNNSASNTTLVENMRLTHYGSLGIGNNAPAEKLHVTGKMRVDTNGTRGIGIYQYSPGPAEMYFESSVYGGSTQTAAIGVDSVNSRDFFIFVNGNDRLNITESGNVGIATSTPAYPLVINKSTTYSTSLSYGYLNNTAPTGTTTASNFTCSVYASARVLATEFNAYSDARIKKNVTDIDDPSALHIIRQVQPKRYNYIDYVKKTNEFVWGFIAQEVANVLPHATGQITDFIPNVFAAATVSNGNTLVLESRSFTGLLLGSEQTVLRIYIDENDTEKIVHVASVVDDITVVIVETIDAARVFVYGQQVQDFHTLNKDAVFTVGIAALQEVDRQIQNAKQLQTLEIAHPAEAEATLVHSTVYAPRCDVLYRGNAVLSNGIAQVDLDVCAVADPTNQLVAGTFEAMCRNAQCFLQNDTSFARLRGNIAGGVLNIECENATSTDEIGWMVVAERKDAYVMSGANGKTNAAGYLKTVRIS